MYILRLCHRFWNFYKKVGFILIVLFMGDTPPIGWKATWRCLPHAFHISSLSIIIIYVYFCTLYVSMENIYILFYSTPVTVNRTNYRQRAHIHPQKLSLFQHQMRIKSSANNRFESHLLRKAQLTQEDNHRVTRLSPWPDRSNRHSRYRR